MNINGYEIALSEEDLKFRLEKQSMDIKLIDENFFGYKNLKPQDKEALVYLVKAGEIINDISLEQDHHLNIMQKKALLEASENSEHSLLALRLLNSFNGIIAYNGIDKEPVEIFKDITGYVGKNFYPIDLSEKEFHSILFKMMSDGKIAEVKKILSARTMVRRKSEELEGIDYNVYFSHFMEEIASNLNEASNLVSNKDFAEYLKLQAIALQNVDENLDMRADMKWASLQNTDLEFTISRESYDDMLTATVYQNKKLLKLLQSHHIEIDAKDMLGIRVGIVNKSGTDLILKFKEGMKHIAPLMPHSDLYVQNILSAGDIKQTMVDVDLISLKGDYAQCRGGITTAQNLPNNDKLSVKNGGGRRNVYHRQVRFSKDKDKVQKILDEFVSQELHHYYSDEADHLFVIGHENGHSFGPDSSYQESMGSSKSVIEEAKADFVSLAFMEEYAKLGVIDEKTLKEVYLSNTVSRLFLSAEPRLEHPHRVAELMQFNYMLEKGIISFDVEGRMVLDFENYAKVLQDLLSEVVEIQLSKSPDKASKFIGKYSTWGKYSKKIEKFIKELGVKPYKIIHEYF